MADLVVERLEKSFGGAPVLKGVSLQIRKGEFFSLLGPSGCGKTTLLRLIAGFESPTSGYIEFEGVRLTDLPAFKRPVNTVFQNYALFPHMNVAQNISFGLRIRKVSRSEIDSRVQEMLDLVNLPHYASRSIASLSGGEKQRIALARALVNRPKILLLDEPLAALDLQLKRKVQFEIKEIHRKVGTTFVYVTHDQEEALAMSDRIAVMRAGVIEQMGNPQEIYDRPDTQFVAHFIGSSNLFKGTIQSRNESDVAEVDVPGLGALQATVRNGSVPGDAVSVLIRPEKVEIVHDSGRSQGLPATISETLYLGPLIQYKLLLSNSQTLVAVCHVTANKSPIRPGNKVKVRWAKEDLVVLEK